VAQMQAQRALTEHAIAALIGEDASRFLLEPRQVTLTLPHVPPGLPSTLLQRRPDVAAAQRRMQAANAGIGVARAAYFPDVTLSGAIGFESDQGNGWIQAPNTYWSFGPNALLTVFDAGRHKAQVAQARAQFDEAAADYRSVALSAFQQIEDNLSLIGRYHIADEAERSAVASAQEALNYSMTRYTAGAVNYLDVVISQTAALQARIEALDITTRQLRASVQLVRALGGGWQGPAAVASN
jgi:NodT family efflux transporter outer membrane factor (OMF) lipoprotein